jgi:hypothetical protein
MKIISYNPATFSQTKQQENLKDITVYNRLMNNNFSKLSFLVDRTKSIPHFLDIDYSYSPIPVNTNTCLDFNTITKNRCLELLSLGKQINVAWSGGIDSTFVLFSLYHYANDPDQIKVYGTYNSIIESGDLFDRFIKNKMRYSIKTNHLAINNFTEQDCIYVTGAMSNQLFTPGLSYNRNRDILLKYKDKFDEGEQDKYNEDLARMADKCYKDVLTDECLEFLTPSILSSPKTINTLQDLRWYTLFNYTWYSVLTNCLIGLDKDTSSRVHAFFNTDEFQLWSINTKDPVTKTGDYSDERWQLREAISDYTGDTYYSTHKKKFTSVLSPIPHNWLYLLNDHTNVFI